MFLVLQDGALFYKKSGLGALPLALFNGVPLSPDEMDPDELETIILQRIMVTTTAFQRAVFMVWHICTERDSPFIFNLPNLYFWARSRTFGLTYIHE